MNIKYDQDKIMKVSKMTVLSIYSLINRRKTVHIYLFISSEGKQFKYFVYVHRVCYAFCGT